jgi:undecaprenyl-diphosphatase
MQKPMHQARGVNVKRYRYFTGLLLGLGAVFHLWYISAGITDLAPDEAHYWGWSRRLDWSYYSKGPMVAYLIAVSTHLGGSTEFFVRFPAVALSLGVGILVFRLGKAIFHDERAGFFAVVLCSAIPLLVAGSMLMTIDAPLVFFWTAALYGLRKAINAAEPEKGGAAKSVGWWIIVGLSLGFGFLSKYTMVLFFLCFSVYLMLSAHARRCLQWSGLGLALLCCVLLAAPVFAWNAGHDWVSVRHVLGQAGLTGKGMRLSVGTFVEFLASQLGVISPLLFFTLAVAVLRSGHLAVRKRNDLQAFLFAFALPPLVFFLLWSIYSKVEANWAAPAYISAVLACAGWWHELLMRAETSAVRFRRVALFVLILLPGVILSLVAHFPASLNRIGVDLPPRLDPTRRLQGWKELGAAIGKLRETPQKAAFLVSDSYQIASELAFYVPGQPAVYNVNLGRRMNQYDIWGGLESMNGQDALFVTSGDREIPEAMRENCEATRKARVVRTFHRGHVAQFFSVFICHSYRAKDFSRARTGY